jgi:opacity protein-like surface antigen
MIFLRKQLGRGAVKNRGLKRHLLASVGFISLAVASSASAGDIAQPSPPAAIWNWSGIYIGAHGGYGWGRDPFSDVVFSGKAPLNGVNSNGFVGGFQAGANWQYGAWVSGLEIDLSATGIKGSSSTSSTLVVGPDSATTTLKQTDKFDLLGSARARLGYLVLPNVLLYGTGGLAWTRFVQEQDATFLISTPTNVPPDPTSATITTTSSFPNWRFGWAAGVGVETRLWDSNWLARVEYLHYDFGQSRTSTSDDTGNTSGHLTADVVRAGLSYKFGQNWLMPAGAAYAAAMPLKAAPTGSPWSWSGFYIGAHAGYGWGRDPFTEPFGTGGVLTGVDSNGFVGGFQAGGNWQRGAWVGGLEIDLSGTGIKGSTTGTVATSPADSDTVTRTDKFELLGSARARLGYLVRPDILVYGTGGLAWTHVTRAFDEVSVSGGSASTFTSSNPSWRFGWVAGLGGETRIQNSNWLARLEYLHYDFGDSGSSFGSSPGTTSGHLTNNVVRAGLSYQFGQGWPAAAVAANAAMPVKAQPASAVPWNWTGFYLGAHAGYGWGRDPMSDAVFGDKAGDPLRAGINSNGFVGGFHAGANLQVNSWVSGVEIDLSGTGIKGSSTTLSSDGSSAETFTDKFNMLGSARARLGYLVRPNVLLYGTGGLAWTRVTVDDVSTDSSGASGGSSPDWKFGWVAGGGGEFRLWDSNWLLRVEYLHYDFGDSGNFTESVVAPPLVSSSSVFTTGHLTANVVRTGLSYKFD